MQVGRGEDEVAEPRHAPHVLVGFLTCGHGAPAIRKQVVLRHVGAFGERGEAHEEGRAGWKRRACERRALMAARAADLGEGVHAAHLLCGECSAVALRVTVVGTARRQQRAFVGRDRLRGVVQRHAVSRAEGCVEVGLVAGYAANAVDHRIEVRHAHLDGIGWRPLCLFFQRWRTCIPELRGQERGIPHAGCVAPTHVAMHADRRRPVIVAAFHDVVAGEARHIAAGRQARVEEQHLPEFDLRGRGRVVCRRRRNVRERLPLPVRCGQGSRGGGDGEQCAGQQRGRTLASSVHVLPAP